MTTLLRFIERLLILAGLCALGWCAYVLADAFLYQYLAKHTFETNPAIAVPSEQARSRVRVVPAGTPVAELDIPRLNLSEAVLEGSDDDTLRRGPGHIEYTAWPGDAGNVGIAGHRDTFFRALRNAKIGDDVLLSTDRGRALYRVTSTRIVEPTDVAVLDPTVQPTLTLVTCYPFSYIGSAPLRYVLQAVRIDRGATPLDVGSEDAAPHTGSPLRP
jgi:sortase A